MNRLAISLVAGAWALAAASTQAAVAAPRDPNCFLSSQWRGWSASQDGDVLYLRVGLKDVYRVGLIPKSRVRKDPDRFLVNRVRGSSWICSPLDLDLDLADHLGFHQHVFVHDLRKLTPAEVAALPKKETPY